MKKVNDQGTVSALKRGIAVMHCFSNGARTLSNGEISALTKVPKPTVTRLAATLVSLGLMRQDPETEKYSLGAGVLSLAQTFLSSLDIRAQARPHMGALAESSGGSVYLGVREGQEMVVIETCRANSSVLTVRLDVGSRLPMATSALGRAYLASLDAAQRPRLLEQLQAAGESDWPKLSSGIDASMLDAAAYGYCASLGELRAEVNSIAVGLILPGGERAAINCGGPAFKFPESRLREEIAPKLLATARAVASEIGGFVILPEQQSKAA
ncbi:MAG: IclR family transcriptional regulator [Candidatus Parcubacteria bacterium]|nr:IclR family transcriptional regulator [Burkholderiales bacterium]